MRVVRKSERGAGLRGDGAPFSSLGRNQLAELAVVRTGVVMPVCTLATGGTRAGTSVALHVGISCVPRRLPELTGSSELELAPEPPGWAVVAQCLEEMYCHVDLHVLVAGIGALQVLGDDAEGTGFVPGVGDDVLLSQLAGQPYHLLSCREYALCVSCYIII